MNNLPATEPPGESFASRLCDWQRTHGRHGLPWQASRDPYRVWLSEVMLQQTQVQTVIDYYQRFLESFPDLRALAEAPVERVMQLWSGLGYYSRARNLHRCAQRVVAEHGGRFPGSADELARLPGIGRSTAAAIAAFCFGERAAILDGNVKRVFCRHFGIEGYPGERRVEQQLWAIAQRELPTEAVDTYTQGLMDLGASLCSRTRPQCGDCPVKASCCAQARGWQARLPAPRPARALPQRECALLVIVREGSVLLEQRPPAGIWGGLLSLPEAEPDSPHALARQAEQRFGLPIEQTLSLEPVRHAFTHFRLLAHPLLLRVAGAAQVPAAVDAANATTRWVASRDLAGQALPKPVRTLLLGLSLE